MSKRRNGDNIQIQRREFLRYGAAGVAAFLGTPLLKGCGGDKNPSVEAVPTFVSNIWNVGSLQAADANGVRLPVGFTSRIVARSEEEPVSGSGFLWHSAPDGGATYKTADGGWIYVSNSERPGGSGGVGALRFNPHATVVDAYAICSGTSVNCAGGRLRGGKWLTCEEHSGGQVYECDPFGLLSPVVRPALGKFTHEAVAEDTVNSHLYLTEDRSDGGFYRFVPDTLTPEGHPDLSSGTLQIAEVAGGGPEGIVTWHTIPDPGASSTSTRHQVGAATHFKGGRGLITARERSCFPRRGTAGSGVTMFHHRSW